MKVLRKVALVTLGCNLVDKRSSTRNGCLIWTFKFVSFHSCLRIERTQDPYSKGGRIEELDRSRSSLGIAVR